LQVVRLWRINMGFLRSKPKTPPTDKPKETPASAPVTPQEPVQEAVNPNEVVYGEGETMQGGGNASTILTSTKGVNELAPIRKPILTGSNNKKTGHQKLYDKLSGIIVSQNKKKLGS